MKRLFLAPHLDDSAISYGGTLLRSVSSDWTTVAMTVFSRSSYTREGLGDAGIVTPLRQQEEKTVMGTIGVETRFLGFLECPLRGYTISHPLDYPRKILPELDPHTAEEIAKVVGGFLTEFDEVLVPLAVGEQAHVDHRIVRLAAEAALARRPGLSVQVYEDAPYIRRADRDRISQLDGVVLRETPIDLERKLRLIQGYKSQPIEAWRDLICQVAGTPPVERTWMLKDVSVLRKMQAV